MDCASGYRGHEALGALARRSHDLAFSDRVNLIDGLLSQYSGDSRHELLENLEPILPLMQRISTPDLRGQMLDSLLDVLTEIS